MDGTLVSYDLSCEPSLDGLIVDLFEAVEELNRPYRIALRVTASDEDTDLEELVGRSALLTLARADHVRRFAGIVGRVVILDDGEVRQRGELELVPALAALALSKTSRIFRDKSALTIVKEVLAERLAPFGRTFDADRPDPDRYAVRDYCVQYQESDLDFVHRLMEEEGIGYYFDFASSDRERLVLIDGPGDFSDAVTMDGGPIRYDHQRRSVLGAEPMVHFEPTKRIAGRGVRVRDYDWARAHPILDQTAGDEVGPPAVYEHGHARHVTITENEELLATMVTAATRAAIPSMLGADLGALLGQLPGAILGSFTTDDAARQARLRAELLARRTRTFRGHSKAIDLAPGRRFDLVGHPTIGADGRYYVVRVHHKSEDLTTENATTIDNYENRLDCLPIDVPWRPERTTPKPRIYGVQTATVTGPAGMNVHTDQHGRIKVKFHWDLTDPDPRGDYTAWIRVGQTWAGDTAPGFMFIPRIGMEVIVTFIDGDPDRPLITGCVYDANNPTPDLLPVRATKSIIRTRTVPHGPGHNELSFEDAMGHERVYLRAERDLDEYVQHDHTNHTKNNQFFVTGGRQVNIVHNGQESVIGGWQLLDITGARHKHVSEGETASIGGNHRQIVRGYDHRRVHGDQDVTVVTGHRHVRVIRGECVTQSKGRMVLGNAEKNYLILNDAEGSKGIGAVTPDTMHLKAGDGELFINRSADGSVLITSPSKIELRVGGSCLKITGEAIQANGKTFPATGPAAPPEDGPAVFDAVGEWHERLMGRDRANQRPSNERADSSSEVEA